MELANKKNNYLYLIMPSYTEVAAEAVAAVRDENNYFPGFGQRKS